MERERIRGWKGSEREKWIEGEEGIEEVGEGVECIHVVRKARRRSIQRHGGGVARVETGRMRRRTWP
jgi:hypothetical protein